MIYLVRESGKEYEIFCYFPEQAVQEVCKMVKKDVLCNISGTEYAVDYPSLDVREVFSDSGMV